MWAEPMWHVELQYKRDCYLIASVTLDRIHSCMSCSRPPTRASLCILEASFVAAILHAQCRFSGFVISKQAAVSDVYFSLKHLSSAYGNGSFDLSLVTAATSIAALPAVLGSRCVLVNVPPVFTGQSHPTKSSFFSRSSIVHRAWSAKLNRPSTLCNPLTNTDVSDFSPTYFQLPAETSLTRATPATHQSTDCCTSPHLPSRHMRGRWSGCLNPSTRSWGRPSSGSRRMGGRG
jgi:hypothetical protein